MTATVPHPNENRYNGSSSSNSLQFFITIEPDVSAEQYTEGALWATLASPMSLANLPKQFNANHRRQGFLDDTHAVRTFLRLASE